MTFLDLCTALREARIAQGLSVEDIADKLKSTSSLIRDLEDANIAKLPHAVYTRGFLRTYAASIKFDLAAYQNMIDATWPINTPDEYEEKIILIPFIDRKRKNNYLILLGVLVSCGLLCGGYWIYSQSKDIAVPVTSAPSLEQGAMVPTSDTMTNSVKTPTSSQNSQSTKPPQLEQSTTPNGENNNTLTAEERLAQDPQEKNTADKDDSVSATEQNALGEDSSANATSSQSQAGPNNHVEDTAPNAQTVSAQENSLEKSPEKSPEKTPATTPNQHVMVITAHEDCWMRLVPDSGEAKQMIVKKGTNFTQHFKKNLEIRFGNPGGVSLAYDGKAIAAPGKSGKAVTIMYPLKD